MTLFRAQTFLCLLGSAGAALLAGCGGGGGYSGGGGGGGNQPTSVTMTAPNGLTATLAENAYIISPGASLTYTYTLTNNTASAISINAPSAAPTAPSGTLAVKNASNTVVYTSLPPPPNTTTATLAPGRSLTKTEVVSAFAAGGSYTANARFADLSPSLSVGPLYVIVQ